MELKSIIAMRHSIRNFLNESVPENILKELVKAAGLAPSINNSQPWKFIAVTNSGILNRMSLAVHKKIEEIFPIRKEESKTIVQKVDRFSTFFGNAPALIVVLNKPYKAVADELLDDNLFTHDDINKLRNYPNVQSIGAAVENILLTAVDLGYGACWLSGLLIAREELETILKVKEPYTIAACVAIGKPVEDTKPKEKKPLEEIIEFIS